MSRLTGDQWINNTGDLKQVECGDTRLSKQGYKLYNGYDYELQTWIIKGKDTKNMTSNQVAELMARKERV